MASNGKLPSSELTSISTPGSLTSDAAAAFERVKKATGTTGTESSNEAYRTYEQQEDLFLDRYQKSYCEYAPGKVDKRYWNGVAYYRKPGESAAAVPGTSNHGWGTTVDFQNIGGYGSSSFNRFASVAPEYGWDNAEGKSVNEPWHWEYMPNKDKHKGEGDGVELNERVKLSDGMRQIAGWTSEDISVGNLLGYLGAGAWGTGKETDGLNAAVKQLQKDMASILANQKAILDALADLNVNVEVDLNAQLPTLTFQATGTLESAEPVEPANEFGDRAN